MLWCDEWGVWNVINCNDRPLTLFHVAVLHSIVFPCLCHNKVKKLSFLKLCVWNLNKRNISRIFWEGFKYNVSINRSIKYKMPWKKVTYYNCSLCSTNSPKPKIFSLPKTKSVYLCQNILTYFLVFTCINYKTCKKSLLLRKWTSKYLSFCHKNDLLIT